MKLTVVYGLVIVGVFLCLVQAAPRRSALGASYVRTPSGWVLEECTHRVPSGAHLEELVDGGFRVTHNGREMGVIPKCDRRNGTVPLFLQEAEPQQLSRKRPSVGSDPFPPDYDGWLGYTAFEYTPGFDAFLGNFSVPTVPPQSPDILYLFTGLQNIDWIPIVDPVPSTPFDIIQPVLQYPGDNGNYWSVKSWYVTMDIGTVESSEVKVAVGDLIFGNMTRVANTTWYIGSTSVETKKTTEVTVNKARLLTQPWAYNTLECYGCESCKTYPTDGSINFSGLSLVADDQVIPAEWEINPKPSKNMKCKETPVVYSPENVTIYFDGAPGQF